MIGPLELSLRIAAILEELDIPYALGGSLASSALGEPRATLDIDVAVDLDDEGLVRLTERLRPAFYVPDQAAAEAVRNRSSFNALGPDGVKVDLFVLGDGPLDRWQIEERIAIEVEPGRSLWLTAPHVLVLRKLDWFRRGGGVSERQWRDVVGVLAVQRSRIDTDALRERAQRLGLDELLRAALNDATD